MVKRFRKLTKRPVLLTVVVVLVLAAVIFGLTRNHKSVSGTIPSTSTSSPTTSNGNKSTLPSASSNPNSTSPTTSSSSNTSTLTLTAPWGNFVSNHSPGKNGAPTSEVSTCNTTPGASCYIQFINNGVTRNLDTKITDTNGSVSWSWDIHSAGLSSGSWQITAVATLNGQTKSTPDQLPLEVQ